LKWARQALAEWLPLALPALGVPCLLHVCLLPAAETQHSSVTASQVDSAMAHGRQFRSRGQFVEALHSFLSAAHGAQAIGDPDRQAKALLSATGCQIRLFRYREALASSEAAQTIGSQTGDYTLLGAAAGNLATIYYQLGDFPYAAEEAGHAVDYLRKSWRKDYLTQALLNQASIEADSGNASLAKDIYREGIAVAQAARLPLQEAKLRDQLGISLLRANKISDADAEITAAYRIYSQKQDQDGLAVINEHRAELELKKGNCEAALHSIDQAFASPSPSFRTSPQFYPIHIRAKILECEGSSRTALAEFRRAVNAADEWRRGALPGDTTNSRTVAYLHDVYQDYTLLAAQLALKDKAPELARQALEVLMENRAASLREQMTRTLGRNLQLPAQYFDLLSQVQELQARTTLGKPSKADSAKLEYLRFRLSDLENHIDSGPGNPRNPTEKIRDKNSLRDIQSRLGENEALLSFCLGENKSFLWTVTDKIVSLYELQAEEAIRAKAYEFTRAVQTGQNSSTAARSLSAQLFGKLDPAVWSKPEWLIVRDGALLDSLPLSALTDLSPARQGAPLIAFHSVRSIPSESLLLTPKTPGPKPRFLGIGDPIYNLADSRRRQKLSLLQARAASAPVTLGRLVGSDQEVRAAAGASGLPDSQLLLGAQASQAALRAALSSSPEIIHFAVHVVSPHDRPEEAALALSLASDNMPELLTPEAIAALRVPGSLVVLSGCASEQGKFLPSAGVMGLSRAWLMAGASAVVVSAWPTPDDSGQFFSIFYRHLRAAQSGSLAERAAAALSETQADMQRTTGYRSSPSFWAAYSIVSKE
jgi:CHAT domain-containing protein